MSPGAASAERSRESSSGACRRVCSKRELTGRSAREQPAGDRVAAERRVSLASSVGRSKRSSTGPPSSRSSSAPPRSTRADERAGDQAPDLAPIRSARAARRLRARTRPQVASSATRCSDSIAPSGESALPGLPAVHSGTVAVKLSSRDVLTHKGSVAGGLTSLGCTPTQAPLLIFAAQVPTRTATPIERLA